MASRQRGELNATADEQRVGADQRGRRRAFGQWSLKGGIDLATAGGGEDFDLRPHG